ncbi:hypothetical protein TNCV_267431 [Trichonephila clavipes]|nr:hypothetical protein TNCV_267431 [Trichonephila clavipes]
MATGSYLTPTYSRSQTTRELLVTDLIVLNHDQVTRTTHELPSPSPNFHATPKGWLQQPSGQGNGLVAGACHEFETSTAED